MCPGKDLVITLFCFTKRSRPHLTIFELGFYNFLTKIQKPGSLFLPFASLKQKHRSAHKTSKTLKQLRVLVLFVPGKGLEPSCLAALAPKASASANFATRAIKTIIPQSSFFENPHIFK